jgi:hypothetical protein
MSDDEDKYTLSIDEIPRLSHPLDKDYVHPQTWMDNLSGDAARYRWLKEHVFEVLCEGRPADCNAKWMLPRLVAEDSTGRKFTFDEIIDIQMKRRGE